jgi:hypothetical protein
MGPKHIDSNQVTATSNIWSWWMISAGVIVAMWAGYIVYEAVFFDTLRLRSLSIQPSQEPFVGYWGIGALSIVSVFVGSYSTLQAVRRWRG